MRDAVQGPGTGRPYLTDFGLAKSVAAVSNLTRTGQALGTPQYMSPEQARGEIAELSPATDVWGLGCALYEMLAGRSPFDGESTLAVVTNVLRSAPRPLHRIRPDAPRAVEAVLGTALAKDPRARYRDATELRDDLDRALAGERPRAARPRSPWRLVALLAVGGTAAAVVASLTLPPSPEGGPGSPADGAGIPAGARSALDSLAAKARAHRGGDPAEAARLLGEALAAAPARADLRVERGLLLWAVGRSAEARDEWSRVGPGAPEAASVRLYLGLEAFFRQIGGERHYEEARPDLEAVAALRVAEAPLARAALAATHSRWGEAREALRAANGWEATLLLGYVEGMDPSGDKAEAVRLYTAALESGIPFGWVHNNRGAYRTLLGDARGARADFDAALRLHPDDEIALSNRTEVRRRLGDLDGAIEDSTRAIALRPAYAAPRYNRGLVRAGKGDRAGAEEDLTEAIRLDPGYAEAHAERARLREDRGDPEGALADYDAAIRLRPRMAEALHNRGTLRMNRGDLRGALEDLDRALAVRPDIPESRVQRGLVRSRLGDAAGALEDYDALLRLRPDSIEALVNRGGILEKRGDFAGAIADQTEALRIRPGLPHALVNRGWAYYRGGDPRRAVEDFRAAIASDPGLPEAHGDLAIALEALSDWAGAAAACRDFLRIAPRHGWAPSVRERLARCEAKAGGEAR